MKPSVQPGADAATESRTLLVNEIYLSLQGESTFAGLPCVFVRLTGCPLRCVWCDTEYAFAGGDRLSVASVLERVASLGVARVEVTGGEPLAQPACLELLRALCDAGHEILLETSGAIDLAGVDPRVAKIMDLKCPGSGESQSNKWENLALLGARDEIKFVLANRADYEWARGVARERGLERAFPGRVLFSAVHASLPLAELAAWIIEDRLDVRLQIQLHKLLWPAETRGV